MGMLKVELLQLLKENKPDKMPYEIDNYNMTTVLFLYYCPTKMIYMGANQSIRWKLNLLEVKFRQVTEDGQK